jgi:hypothetical protein
VFVNIAHRSQVLVHRQLKVLDRVERAEDDPDQLELLFELDHLTTRARRNAENLLILGGHRSGRQWRNPVSLLAVVRSAIAETERYVRVETGVVPGVAVVGTAVADVIHLLAELIDNATAFSPPQSRVEVRGGVVGQGVAIEVVDQGLGMDPVERDRVNEMLRAPAEFDRMALARDSRLGLFVVARLAGLHEVGVSLAESAYGGTCAVVLLRSALLSPDTGSAPADTGPLRTTRPFQARAHAQAGLSPARLPAARPATRELEAGTAPPDDARPPLSVVGDAVRRVQPGAQQSLPQRVKQASLAAGLRGVPPAARATAGGPPRDRAPGQQGQAPAGEPDRQVSGRDVAWPAAADVRARLSAFQRASRDGRRDPGRPDDGRGGIGDDPQRR